MKLRIFLLSLLTSAFAFAQQAAEPTLKANAIVVRGLEFFNTFGKEDGPAAENVRDGKRGEPLYLAVYFSGAKAGPDGNANVTYSLMMKKPNGAQLGPQPGITARIGKLPTEDKTAIYLATQRPRIPITEADAAGKYSFEIKVKDNVSGDEVPITFDVEIK